MILLRQMIMRICGVLILIKMIVMLATWNVEYSGILVILLAFCGLMIASPDTVNIWTYEGERTICIPCITTLGVFFGFWFFKYEHEFLLETPRRIVTPFIGITFSELHTFGLVLGWWSTEIVIALRNSRVSHL